VHISQQDENGNVVKKWYATRATFDKDKASWALYDGMIVDFDAKGDITRTDAFPNQVRVIDGWTETPLRIESSQLQAQNLSIQELRDYLGYNGDFPPTLLAPYRTNLYDRWAFPWSCLVIVFIAAPLGVVYNRRGVLGGVAGAIFLFICTILLRYFLLALGKGARLDPMAAAWLPNLIFFLVGLVLLFYRATNRDFPKLLFWR
jgi:lipopolysaccharide export LptBFGC system permease protein LptF